MKKVIFRPRIVAVAVGAVCLAAAVSGDAIAAGVTLADSVNDFPDASQNNQNFVEQNGWLYGYYSTPGDPSTFVQAPNTVIPDNRGWVAGEFIGYSQSIFNSPWISSDTQSTYDNNGNFLWSVRRWENGNSLNPYSGQIEIKGDFHEVNSFDDGTIGRIFIDGLEITPTVVNNVTQNTSAVPNMGDGIKYVGGDLLEYVAQASINANSVIDFALDPRENTRDDSTLFTAVISQSHIPSAPTPALLPGLMGFGASLLRKRRQLSDA